MEQRGRDVDADAGVYREVGEVGASTYLLELQLRPSPVVGIRIQAGSQKAPHSGGIHGDGSRSSGGMEMGERFLSGREDMAGHLEIPRCKRSQGDWDWDRIGLAGCGTQFDSSDGTRTKTRCSYFSAGREIRLLEGRGGGYLGE